ncbi:MAG: hypothetical protein QOF65_2848, partial [Thermoleophilaceae bacterium]|nr:hypothetical protein [Thermoleophilaceae bacterium]
DTGATGAKGDTGAQGLPGPFPATLPAGKTLTGLFGMLGDDDGTGQHEGAATEISFPYPLAADPVVTIIQAGGAPTTACPGTPDVPKATSGHLCIYVAIQAGNANTLSFYNPTSDSKYGVVLYTNGTSTGRIDEAGTWAVTG